MWASVSISTPVENPELLDILLKLGEITIYNMHTSIPVSPITRHFFLSDLLLPISVFIQHHLHEILLIFYLQVTLGVANTGSYMDLRDNTSHAAHQTIDLA